MRAIGGARSLAITQAGLRRDLRGLFGDMASDISGLTVRSAGPDGRIPRRRESALAAQADGVVMRYFVGSDGRSAFGEDGVTALAEYPRILNRWIVSVSRQVVAAHHDWLKRSAPDDVYAWLASGRRLRELRIVEAKQISAFEAPHTWVDPRGHVLSDRVWLNGLRTAQKVDGMLADAIRSGRSALALAKDLEGFLLPGRVGRRTTRPYGRDASADAMRLARTEISHAHGQISYAASLANPYVGGWDWALSPSHPRMDVCDGLATVGRGGERLRDPYPLAGAPIPPAHPYCLCYGRGVVVESAATVTARLRAAMHDGEEPPLTPARADAFLRALLGALLAAEFIERLAA